MRTLNDIIAEMTSDKTITKEDIVNEYNYCRKYKQPNGAERNVSNFESFVRDIYKKDFCVTQA